MRIIKSIKFRYNHFKKQRQANKIAGLKQKHNCYMDSLRPEKFTIISSNCWGGSVYEDLKRPYLTPTVGMYFMAPCFLELLSDLKGYMEKPLKFVLESKYPEVNQFRKEKHWFPIGKLGDIELQFLHYTSEQEALEKWNRRKSRIVWDNIYIATCDRDRMSASYMNVFDKLPYENKVIFTSNPQTNIKCAVQLKGFKKDTEVGDLYNQRYLVTRDFNLKQWLS